MVYFLSAPVVYFYSALDTEPLAPSSEIDHSFLEAGFFIRMNPLYYAEFSKLPRLGLRAPVRRARLPSVCLRASRASITLMRAPVIPALRSAGTFVPSGSGQ